MAVVDVKRNLPDLQGLSTDEKGGAENGCLFHVVDTGDVYVRHEGTWVKDLRMARAVKDAAAL